MPFLSQNFSNTKCMLLLKTRIVKNKRLLLIVFTLIVFISSSIWAAKYRCTPLLKFISAICYETLIWKYVIPIMGSKGRFGLITYHTTHFLNIQRLKSTDSFFIFSFDDAWLLLYSRKRTILKFIYYPDKQFR